MTLEPVEAFPVGDLLQEELESRGWTQADFAEILGRPAQFVSEITSGKKEITRESATQISAALGPSPEFWLRYQDAYHLWKQTQDVEGRQQLEDVRLRVQLNKLASLGILRRRGVITAENVRGQARQLCQLLEIDSLDDRPHFAVASRRSNVDEELSSLQVSWLACVRRLARNRKVAAYSPDGLRDLAGRLTRIVYKPHALALLPIMFAEVGVHLIYDELFPSSKLDGATFVMDGVPVIGISGRGQRLDKILFTILHEIAHILLGHAESRLVLDEGDLHDEEQEGQADKLAADWTLPDQLGAVPERINQSWINKVANEQGVHPIVVVGRLQNRGLLRWRTVLAKDAPTVVEQLKSWR